MGGARYGWGKIWVGQVGISVTSSVLLICPTHLSYWCSCCGQLQLNMHSQL